MTQASTPNGLDLAAIHPRNGERYSPNLLAWLAAPGKEYRATTSRVFVDAQGALWIGLLDAEFLIGARLIGVLCNGRKEQSFARCMGELTEVQGFWERYTAMGRCAIDSTHSMYFRNDGTRWLTDGDHRHCLWCGNHTQRLRRWVEPVERTAWEPVPPVNGESIHHQPESANA